MFIPTREKFTVTRFIYKMSCARRRLNLVIHVFYSFFTVPPRTYFQPHAATVHDEGVLNSLDNILQTFLVLHITITDIQTH